jgi:hypothetical protein
LEAIAWWFIEVRFRSKTALFPFLAPSLLWIGKRTLSTSLDMFNPVCLWPAAVIFYLMGVIINRRDNFSSHAFNKVRKRYRSFEFWSFQLAGIGIKHLTSFSPGASVAMVIEKEP